MKQKINYYFSQKQEQSVRDIDGYFETFVVIGGEQKQYSEKRHIKYGPSEWDDAIFLGTKED